LDERELGRRRAAFMAIIRRCWVFWPWSVVEPWALAQFELVSAGSRNRFEVSDQALGAWARSGPASWQEREAREIWGRGWAQGVEVDER
jgi:hypothetical protein